MADACGTRDGTRERSGARFMSSNCLKRLARSRGAEPLTPRSVGRGLAHYMLPLFRLDGRLDPDRAPERLRPAVTAGDGFAGDCAFSQFVQLLSRLRAAFSMSQALQQEPRIFKGSRRLAPNPCDKNATRQACVSPPDRRSSLGSARDSPKFFPSKSPGLR